MRPHPPHPRPFDVTILLIEHDMKVVMGDLRAHRRARATARRSPRETPERSSANPKVIEAYLGEAASVMLKVETALERPLRRHPRAAGRRPRRSTQGEIVTPHRRERRGQDTTLRTISGLLQPRRAARSRSTASELTGARPHEIVALGVCARARGAAGLRRTSRCDENLTLGAYPRTRPAPASRPTASKVFGLFPRLKERAQPEGRHALRRRAADARHRPGAHGAAAAAPARRAVAGPRAAAS